MAPAPVLTQVPNPEALWTGDDRPRRFYEAPSTG